MSKKIKRGGFSKEMWEGCKELRDYTETNFFYGGYMGHEDRRTSFDKVVEETMKRLKTPNESMKFYYLGIWLTSGDARHFMDALEERTPAGKRKLLAAYMPTIFNKGFLYSRPEHGGTMDSTDKLRKRYEAAGFLMAEKKVNW